MSGLGSLGLYNVTVGKKQEEYEYISTHDLKRLYKQGDELAIESIQSIVKIYHENLLEISASDNIDNLHMEFNFMRQLFGIKLEEFQNLFENADNHKAENLISFLAFAHFKIAEILEADNLGVVDRFRK